MSIPETLPTDATSTNPARLSFALLEAHIHAMPDGPASRLDHPRWALICGWLTMACVLAGLLPVLLVQWITPGQWMVGMARAGLWGAFAFSLPFILRVLWVIGTGIRGWRKELVLQSDHDRAAFGELRAWLSGFSREELEDHHRFAKLAAERLAAKLPLIVGAVDRLGALPLLAAMFVLAQGVDGLSLASLSGMQAWKGVVGVGLILGYVIGVHAVRNRLRLQLYEVVLADALAHQRVSDAASSPQRSGR